jgi:hypothetical protein
VGSHDVMREQVEHLIELQKLPNVQVRIIPRAAGAYRAMGRSFKVLEFREAPEYKIAYAEHGAGGAIYLDASEAVRKVEKDYLHVASVALSPDDSVELLHQIARNYE